MSEISRIFPLNRFLRFLRWMIPLTALLTYLSKLGGRPHEDYVGGHYWFSWLIIIGLFSGGWVLVRLQMELRRVNLAEVKYCPTCGQLMPHAKDN